MIRLALLGLLACMASMGEGLGVEVEDVTGRQLEAALETENLLGVMFYSKNCKTCDRVLSVLERVGEEVATNGITLVRVNDKKAAKTHAIRNFPALSLFKMGEALHYEGDLTDADAILDFLSSPEALDVPGQIEDVTASQLEVLVQHQNFVAVFFYDADDKTSLNCLSALESIDDDLDEHKIPAVKMSDTSEARQYGVKTFPSIIVFVKKIPELYQGDVTDEAAVLGWALTQAGIKVESEGDEDEEDDNDILSFPSASAEKAAPATPKVAPKAAKTEPEAKKAVKKPTAAKEAVKEPEVPKVKEKLKAEQPKVEEPVDELSETVDTIKNDNNVVVFFYPSLGSLGQKNYTNGREEEDEQELKDELESNFVKALNYDHGQESLSSCWPLTCASAKKISHKALNIDKLTTRPLIRVGEKKEKEPVGWIGWIFGFDSAPSEETIEESEDEEGEEEDAGEEVVEGEDEEIEEDEELEEEFEEEEQVEDEDITLDNTELEEEINEDSGGPNWYSVNLLGDEDWFSVNLFGEDATSGDERNWFDIDLFGDSGDEPGWFGINLFGDEDDSQNWYEIDLFGSNEKDEVKVVCAEIDHDQRSWYEIAPLGFCDDGVKEWYEVELLTVPGVSGYEEDVDQSILSVDLLGSEYENVDNSNWYDIDLLNERFSATEEESDSETTEDDDDIEENLQEEEPPVKDSLEEEVDSTDDDEVSDEEEEAVEEDEEENAEESVEEETVEEESVEEETVEEETAEEENVEEESLDETADEEVEEKPVDDEGEDESEELVDEAEAEEDLPIEETEDEETIEEEIDAAEDNTESADDVATGSWFFGSSEVEEDETDTGEEEEEESVEETLEEEEETLEEEPIEETLEEEEESDEESPESVKSKKLTKTDINQLLDEKSEVLEELTKYIMAKILHENQDQIVESQRKFKKPVVSIQEDEAEQVEVKESEPVPEPEILSETAAVVKQNKNVIIFFYETMDKISKKIINGLDKVEGNFIGKDIQFLAVDIDEVPDIEVASVPSLIYFKNGEPVVYEENLMNEEAIREWVDEELKSNLDVIEDLNTEQIHELMDENEYVMVYLYASDCEACDEAIKQLEQIDDDADAVGVKFVKTDEAEFAAEYGIESFPAILYFENKQPSIYDGDAAEETELLTWLLYQMKEDTIENINRELLIKMIDEFEFLAVYFYEDNEDSVKVLRHLELIDDEASQYGVRMVKLDDPLMSKKYGHRAPPGLGFFRKGNYVKFDGDLFDDEEMLDWLTDPAVMEISDQIEKVNKKMFEKLITRNEFLTVLFYSDTDCKQCEGVLQELENIDDDAETAGIPIVKLEDKELAKTVGVFALPAVVFFRNFGEEAVIYTGDLKREESILEWLMVQKDPSNDAIEELEGDELRKSVGSSDAVAVFIYSHEECENCLETLTELENIDDDVERQKIQMVKTTDAAFAEEVGIEKYPALVFFKEGVPNLYEGDLTVEEEVLDWLTEMKVESHIELITRPMLETMVEETQYLAVFFYKQNCRTCDQVIAELENIDDECDQYGIQLVKLKDPPLAKRYGIKTFPALVYFRNGNPLTFEGDLKSEESVLEWLVDDDNRELEDEIEAVNFRMLDKLLETSPLMAVFFYDDECVECDAILEELETVDDEADAYGIDFVKNNDPHAARQYNIYNTPALVYFRRMSPVVFDGDLMDGERILEWLTSQDVFETKDEIEEVNRKMLEKLLDENEFVAVYFYEDNCLECDEAMEGLEKIDDETDALDITFVKVNDPRYAKKYGVNKLPALVYFRRKFPSIYRDSLFDEDNILEWLTSNRYKQLELGVFMYAIVSLAVTFICYTAFLMFGLKPREPEKKKEE
eukprot:GFUD01015795.1.p1 GENE.GFUD01015795.1~~GFUD01015795.1.p1  ORF type:complete len:1842 (+),score=695.57 GFUD01015795.1:98-5623(+)